MKHSKAFLALKKEIKELSDFNRGFYSDFWIAYIHGIYDQPKYGKLTEEEAIELEDYLNRKK